MEKMTKRTKLEAIIKTFETGECPIDPAVIVEFCEGEIALLDKKAAKAKDRAATKKAEPDVLTNLVAAALTEDFAPIAEIAAKVCAEDADATTSKVTYRLSKLVDAGVAEKTQITIPATETTKARKVQAYRAVIAD